MAANDRAALPTAGPPAADDTPTTRRAALDGSLRCVLDDRGLLAFSGADATEFLHSQFSTDVRGMAPGASTLTSYSDARGRLLMVGRLHATPERFLLELPADRLEPVRQQLRKYVLRAAVSIDDVSGEIARFGAAGQSAAVALHAVTGALPEAPGTSSAGLHSIRLAGPRPRWLFLGEPTAVRAAWEALGDHAATGSPEAWRLLDIAAGIPTVREATAGRFVAQMLNLDLLGGVDFRKGCYPGQEVIARTHYLGRIKRRMRLLHAAHAGIAPAPGSGILSGDSTIGEVVDAALHPDGGADLLAVIRTEAVGPFTLGDEPGIEAEPRELPYAVDEVAA